MLQRLAIAHDRRPPLACAHGCVRERRAACVLQRLSVSHDRLSPLASPHESIVGPQVVCVLQRLAIAHDRQPLPTSVHDGRSHMRNRDAAAAVTQRQQEAEMRSRRQGSAAAATQGKWQDVEAREVPYTIKDAVMHGDKNAVMHGDKAPPSLRDRGKWLKCVRVLLKVSHSHLHRAHTTEHAPPHATPTVTHTVTAHVRATRRYHKAHGSHTIRETPPLKERPAARRSSTRAA